MSSSVSDSCLLEMFNSRYNLRSRSRTSVSSVGSTLSNKENEDENVFVTPNKSPVASGRALAQLNQDGLCDNSILSMFNSLHLRQQEPTPQSENNEKLDTISIEPTVDVTLFKDVTSQYSVEFYPDIVALESPNPKFVPVDVTRSPDELFVTSQYSDEVAIFKDDKYVGELKPGKFKRFNSPRNVHYLNIGIIIVLDNLGFHFFKGTSNEYIGTAMAGKGYKYRGLGYFTCSKDNLTYLTSLQVHNKDVTLLSVFKVDPKGHLSLVKDITIEETRACESDPKCRFVAVYSNCDLKTGCLTHTAYVTAMDKGEIYSVDINNSISKEFVWEGEPPLNTTFAGDKVCMRIPFLKPTGVCVDIFGNVTIVDHQNENARMFDCHGKWLLTVDLGCQGIGVHLNPEEGVMYAASLDKRKVMKYLLKDRIENASQKTR